jgi:hypothetical protein
MNVIDINIIDCIDPDAEISGPDLSDSCSNSDDSQASGNVGSGDGGGNGGSGGSYVDEDDGNEDWAFWG